MLSVDYLEAVKWLESGKWWHLLVFIAVIAIIIAVVFAVKYKPNMIQMITMVLSLHHKRFVSVETAGILETYAVQVLLSVCSVFCLYYTAPEPSNGAGLFWCRALYTVTAIWGVFCAIKTIQFFGAKLAKTPGHDVIFEKMTHLIGRKNGLVNFEFSNGICQMEKKAAGKIQKTTYKHPAITVEKAVNFADEPLVLIQCFETLRRANSLKVAEKDGIIKVESSCDFCGFNTKKMINTFLRGGVGSITPFPNNEDTFNFTVPGIEFTELCDTVTMFGKVVACSLDSQLEFICTAENTKVTRNFAYQRWNWNGVTFSKSGECTFDGRDFAKFKDLALISETVHFQGFGNKTTFAVTFKVKRGLVTYEEWIESVVQEGNTLPLEEPESLNADNTEAAVIPSEATGLLQNAAVTRTEGSFRYSNQDVFLRQALSTISEKVEKLSTLNTRKVRLSNYVSEQIDPVENDENEPPK